ncbi:MAG: response regulator [Lachnospiraceae bacterium]|nr:response regulator [Lachnospiraceae bacterium]
MNLADGQVYNRPSKKGRCPPQPADYQISGDFESQRSCDREVVVKRKQIKNRINKEVPPLLFSIIVVFFILGMLVFAISRKITEEMSSSAIHNLNESLVLIKGTIEAILVKESEFQKLIAQEIATLDELEEFVSAYNKNETMVKVSVILEGKSEGISNTKETFSEEGLDFSAGKTVGGLPISQSYLNDMGTWAYTMKCPVEKEGKQIATLYVEYIYDSFDEALPKGFYNGSAMLYIMDAKSERLVLKPKGMGERNAGHLNLEDFYRANRILEKELQDEVSECIAQGKNIMFYHDIRGQHSLIYMWAVNGGAVYLIGYVPIEAIQQEGRAVNQNILFVILIMFVAFFLCCLLYYLNQRQQIRIRKEREKEREMHNRQLAEALQAAQVASNSKTMFLSNMSHDIRTPMNAILGFAALLEKDAEKPFKVREYTKKIMASGQHLLSLINDILDVSKIESGKVVLTIGEFTIGDLVTSVDTIIRPMANEKEQNLHTSVTGIKHEYLEGDETRLNQVLINLLSNAVKYTPKGGNIWFRIIGLEQHSSQFEHIRIEVEDNGYGMTEEYLKTIFEAFTRAENSTTNKVQGTGLGMAITKNIVELMGGTITVSSQVDKGSLFRVELELRILDEQDEKKKEEEAAEDMEEISLEGLHLLAAEDNEINAEILSELLNIEGVSCEIVENGKIAAERFADSEEGKFDAILMDVQMPVMNGYEATRAIRALKRDDAVQIPIIAMTANAFAEDVKEALNAGMNAHVAKPIDMKLLKKTLYQWIQRKG